jgi:6-phospho-3-hexuloisomerase
MYTQAKTILAEVDRVLGQVDQAQVDNLLDAIAAARGIVVYGLGREGLVMRSFAMRLMHLGLRVAVVGDMTTPPVGTGDLFLVSCGPGYLSTVEALAGVAGRAGARIFMITAQPQAELPRRADDLLVISAQTMAEHDHASSEQAMGSAFEQAMWILFDALIPELQACLGQTVEQLRGRHTNLE